MEKFMDAVGSPTPTHDAHSLQGSELGRVRGIGGPYEVETIEQVWRELDRVVSRLQFLRAQCLSQNGRPALQQGLGDFLGMTISHLVQVIRKGRQFTRNEQ